MSLQGAAQMTRVRKYRLLRGETRRPPARTDEDGRELLCDDDNASFLMEGLHPLRTRVPAVSAPQSATCNTRAGPAPRRRRREAVLLPPRPTAPRDRACAAQHGPTPAHAGPARPPRSARPAASPRAEGPRRLAPRPRRQPGRRPHLQHDRQPRAEHLRHRRRAVSHHPARAARRRVDLGSGRPPRRPRCVLLPRASPQSQS